MHYSNVGMIRQGFGMPMVEFISSERFFYKGFHEGNGVAVVVLFK